MSTGFNVWAKRVVVLAASLGMVMTPAMAMSATAVAQAPNRSSQDAGGIRSARATDRVIEVAGAASARSTVHVHALGTEQSPGDWAEGELVATVGADRRGRFTARFAATAPGGQNRLYEQFVAEVNGVAIGGSRYVDDYAFRPISSISPPQPNSSKGVVVAQLTDDAEQLGLGHSLVNVSVNRVMIPGALADGKSIEFDSGGRQWHFDADRVASLDRSFRVLTDNGVVPSAILKVEANRPGQDVAELVHPGAIPDAVPGEQYMFNTATAQGVAAFTAAVEFLTERYTRSDGRYGTVPTWIVGNEVDSAFKWMNMGEVSVDHFVEDYSRAVRIVDQAAHRSYRYARTFVPLDYCWNVGCDKNPDESRPTRFFKGRDVIDRLAAVMGAEGDVGWGLAYHPYPEGLINPRVWQNVEATDSFDTRLVTPKNLQVLPAYLDQSQLRFDGRRRAIAATEWGCNTLSSSTEDLDLQAACFAYSAYKMRFTPGIEWFNYFRDLDYELTSSSPLQPGLWATDPEQPSGRQPVGEPKPIYAVMRDIDTSRSLAATAFALPIIGIHDWSEVIPGFDPKKLDTTREPVTVPAGIGGTAVGGRTLYDFSTSEQGWHVSDDATDVHVGDGALSTTFSAKAAKQRSAARVDFDRPRDLSRTPVIGLRLRTAGDPGHQLQSNVTWSATVRVYATDGRRADAEARVRADGQWQQITVDLSRWRGSTKVTGLKVALSASSNRALTAAFEIDDVRAARTVDVSGAGLNLGLKASVTGTPSTVTTGDPLSLTVTGWGRVPRRALAVVTACDGVITQPVTIEVGGLAPGASRTVRLALTEYSPADRAAPTLCLTVGAETLRVGLTFVPPPPPPPPPAPDAHPTVAFRDGFDNDSSADYSRFAMQPENDALPEASFGAGVVSATSPSNWFGAFQTGVSPATPRISTVLEIGTFAPNGIGNVVYTGLVKDDRNAIMGLYVKSARYAAFEVRIDGKVSLSNQITGLDLEDGVKLGFSLDGLSASLWADRGDGRGWQLLGDTVLRRSPDLSDPAVRADWHYAFSLRSQAGETITASSFEGRSRP